MSVMISLMSVRSAALGQRGGSILKARREVHGPGGGRRELIELRIDPLEG